MGDAAVAAGNADDDDDNDEDDNDHVELRPNGSRFSQFSAHTHLSSFIYPLSARVVGAPQMISQPVFSIFSLFSTALWDLPNSRPVHSLMLSSHLFLCLPCLLPPFTAPCKMVLARPDERET